MRATALEQGTINLSEQQLDILECIEAFLVDRKAQGLSMGTVEFYRKKLRLFAFYCDGLVLTRITDLTPAYLRLFLLFLEEKGHNPGGVHATYRALRAFLLWWEREFEPIGWKNPIRKVKAPKLAVEPLDPVDLNVVKAMVDTSERNTFTGDRDRAMLLGLLDTGARASEFMALNLEDVNQMTGEVLIRRGKGGAPRVVFLGARSRKALRLYLRHRPNPAHAALWVSEEGERLTYSGLRDVMRRRSALAGVKTPSIHSFRRYFALSMLRAGVDVFSIQLLMGHADLQVLRRYLKQVSGDLEAAHRRGSPVDLANW